MAIDEGYVLNVYALGDFVHSQCEARHAARLVDLVLDQLAGEQATSSIVGSPRGWQLLVSASPSEHERVPAALDWLRRKRANADDAFVGVYWLGDAVTTPAELEMAREWVKATMLRLGNYGGPTRRVRAIDAPPVLIAIADRPTHEAIAQTVRLFREHRT